MKAPLFRDPIYDGATDPTIIYNRETKEWWMVYTSRRATAEGPGVAWVHGSDLGVATSADGGRNWVYRGTLPGLDFEWGRNTFWAPEIYWHEGIYHMYVSYIQGIQVEWTGDRRIIHYTSKTLIDWQLEGPLSLSSNRVIDVCVHEIPGGGFRMWYKDEEHGSATYAADSDDLYHWHSARPVLTHRGHEGPNVFRFKGSYWMIIDEWRGQGVYRSDDLDNWDRNGMILEIPGVRKDDEWIGHHADVVVSGDEAYVFYFTHPGRSGMQEGAKEGYEQRRSSVQAARLDVRDGILVCDRNEDFEINLIHE
ncbi:glycosyl hydrolase [Paenibacillus glycanilyticus]|uniref:Glycosyl hydrolase n=1 Tax=Paenibacillus glycanilyticus TaxID=126569 RepID=A0ABQ6NEU5_9BACL|nr:glycosyl hydrolase [Paenibacillus glycanilyticus]GMK43224.1 glycosyl hydrolase [Paenibacillus glycanilyticus]